MPRLNYVKEGRWLSIAIGKEIQVGADFRITSSYAIAPFKKDIYKFISHFILRYFLKSKLTLTKKKNTYIFLPSLFMVNMYAS